MTLGAKEFKYQNKEDGFIFTAKEGSAEHRVLRNHPDYDLIDLEAVVEPLEDDNLIDNQVDGSEEKDQPTDEFEGESEIQEDPIAPAEVEPVDFNDYTVDQLIEVAKEMGITGYSSMKKKELIKAISEDE